MALYPGSGFYPDDFAYPSVPADRTLTATPEPGHTPPRVRLDFSDNTGSPVTSVTITRTDVSGRSYPVRTTDGAPSQLSGAPVTLYDYEARYGSPVTYSTDAPQSPSAVTTLAVDRPWLIHPGIPSRSVTFTHGAGSHASEDWDIDQGAFQILGRSTPVIATSGARYAPASTLVVVISTDEEREALKLLLSDGATLLMNVPTSRSWGVDTDYIAVGKVPVDRLSPVLTEPHRNITLPYQVVARPGGGTQAAFTWDTVASQYATWADLAATGLTWAQLAAQTG